MAGESPTLTIVRFGPFELSRETAELRKDGVRLKLSGQPIQVLIRLIATPGKLVTREELQQQLWPGNTYGDFEKGLNAAVTRLRTYLNDSATDPQYIETIPGRGYRFIVPVIELPSANGSVLARDSHPATWEPRPAPLDISVPAEKKPAANLPKLLLGTVAGLAILTGTVLLYRGQRIKQTSQPAIKSLAVLPLKNLSGDPSQEYLADGMTEELIGRLSGIHDLRVISRTSAMQFKDTHMSAPEIAKALQVDALVEGSVNREGNRIRVHAQLIRGATDEHFWSEEYDRELQDVLALQSDVAQAIAEKVQVTVTGKERTRLVAARSVAPEVYEIYLKALYAPDNTKAEVEQTIAQFEEAIHKDPTFAPAYVSLASEYEYLGTIIIGGNPVVTRPKVISSAQRALELDPTLAAPHILLAGSYQRRWQWREAEAEYKRALELGPNDADAYRGYADWLLCQGRIDEALAWARRARELDPLGGGGAQIGWILIMGHRYDEAIREVKTTLSVHPNAAGPQFFLAFALIFNGQADEATSLLEKTVERTNRSIGSLEFLATAYAHAGRRTDALRLINELKQRQKTGYVPAGAFINPYLALGDYDQAFYWCEEAYKEQSNILATLKAHPSFDPVRGDPRFQDLLRRVGLN